MLQNTLQIFLHLWGYKLNPIIWIFPRESKKGATATMYSVIDWQRQVWEKPLLPDQLHHLTILWPHQLAEVNVPHVVTEGFIWAFAEPAHNLFLFLPIDVDLAQESEFFLE